MQVPNYLVANAFLVQALCVLLPRLCGPFPCVMDPNISTRGAVDVMMATSAALPACERQKWQSGKGKLAEVPWS